MADLSGSFTGLLLVTGLTSPNAEKSFLDTLAPFTIEILDKQSMQIRDRYFLTIYFKLDKAHERAITKDLEATAEKLKLDLALDYRLEP